MRVRVFRLYESVESVAYSRPREVVMTERNHLPQSFYSQLGIYLVVNILLVLAAAAAEGARWWYWMIPVVWSIALAVYGVWLYWFNNEVHEELTAEQQQAGVREKEETVHWLEGFGSGSDGAPPHHP